MCGGYFHANNSTWTPAIRNSLKGSAQSLQKNTSLGRVEKKPNPNMYEWRKYKRHNQGNKVANKKKKKKMSFIKVLIIKQINAYAAENNA